MSYTKEQIEMIIKENEKLKKENEKLKEENFNQFSKHLHSLETVRKEDLKATREIIKEKENTIDELRKEIIEYDNVGIFNMIMLETKYGQTHYNRVKEEFLIDIYHDIDSLVCYVDKHLLDCQKNAFFKYLNFSVYEDEKELLENHQVETLEDLQDDGYFIINTLWSDELLVLEP
jgi:hypothetical protein